jgi:hypothetical protein
MFHSDVLNKNLTSDNRPNRIIVPDILLDLITFSGDFHWNFVGLSWRSRLLDSSLFPVLLIILLVSDLRNLFYLCGSQVLVLLAIAGLLAADWAELSWDSFWIPCRFYWRLMMALLSVCFSDDQQHNVVKIDKTVEKKSLRIQPKRSKRSGKPQFRKGQKHEIFLISCKRKNAWLLARTD